MRVLAFSDLHRDLQQAATLVEMAASADVVIGAGDFASIHEGLEETIGALATIEAPSLLVPGNNETADALREAAGAWRSATVLHGEGTTIDGIDFFGLGAGVPTTPWEWSFDLTDDEVSKLRDVFRAKGIEYKVVKNKLVQQALADQPWSKGLTPVLRGMTGVAWSFEEPSAAARVVKDFVKDNEKLKVKAGLLGHYPSLAPQDLFQGDIKYSTDFRSVYAGVLESWLKTKSAPILGKQFTPLQVV